MSVNEPDRNDNNEIAHRADTAGEDSTEQGVPSLPGRRKSRVGKLKIVLLALVAIAFFAGGVSMYLQRLYQQHQEDKQAALQKPKDSGDNDTTVDIAGQQARIKREEADQARRASELVAASASASTALATPAGAASQPAATTAQTQSGPPIVTPAQRRFDGGVLAGSSSGGSDGTTDGDSPGSSGRPAGGRPPATGSGTGERLAGIGSAAGGKESELDAMLKPSSLVAVRASFRPDRHTLLSRNTMIRCVQDTAIVTDYPGLTGCTIAEDVWSDDGSTLLIRKGAEAKGEQRQALMQGQGRIFTIWNEIDDGDVKIPLDSPGTDALGASGQPAYVDEHFWLRFKGAIMVSLIGDFGQALANKATGSGNQISFSNSSNATQDVAAESLRNTINIPPTAYSNQGSIINIFVARDVDLSQQYENVGPDGNPSSPGQESRQ
jgi:type IV secretion system protein VirB10